MIFPIDENIEYSYNNDINFNEFYMGSSVKKIKYYKKKQYKLYQIKQTFLLTKRIFIQRKKKKYKGQINKDEENKIYKRWKHDQIKRNAQFVEDLELQYKLNTIEKNKLLLVMDFFFKQFDNLDDTSNDSNYNLKEDIYSFQQLYLQDIKDDLME